MRLTDDVRGETVSERLTSPEDYAALKAAIDQLVDELEADGFSRGQVGAAMAGIGLGVSIVWNGKAETLRIVKRIHDELLLEPATP